jgi:hypothetical protein
MVPVSWKTWDKNMNQLYNTVASDKIKIIFVYDRILGYSYFHVIISNYEKQETLFRFSFFW